MSADLEILMEQTQTSVSISNWNISDSSRVVIPNASILINLKPDQILAYGSARVGGDGTIGSVSSDEIIFGELSLRAPLEFQISEDALISTDPTLFNENSTEIIPDEIENIVLFVQYDNDFEFGSKVTVSISKDINELFIGPTITGIDSIELNDDRLGLFNQDSIYINVEIGVIGKEDEYGNPVSSKFLSTDKMELNIYGRIQYFIDGSELQHPNEKIYISYYILYHSCIWAE